MSDPAPVTHPRRSVGSRLVGLNFALLIALGVLTILSTSTPSGGGAGSPQPEAPRGRGEYTIVSGKFQGGTSNAVYILDAANQELVALSWNRSKDEMEIVGHRKISEDVQFKPGR